MVRQVTTAPYNTDVVQWSIRTAQLFREQRFDEVDLESVIEEIEHVGRREKQALYSSLKILLMHLLKWQIQSSHQSNSWRATILNIANG